MRMKNVVTAKAFQLIENATTPQGILASPIEKDNYRRIWARDSIIAGIAGLIGKQDKIIHGLCQSLNSLRDHAHSTGFIPSNIGVEKASKVSYGSLAGRVDALLWYIVGVGLYARYSKDQTFIKAHQTTIERCLYICDIWEYNGRHLLYTPLSGNWADEYPLHGYLLYDNALRLYGLKLMKSIYAELDLTAKIEDIEQAVSINFWPDSGLQDSKLVIHKRLYEEKAMRPCLRFSAGLNPSGYYDMWDMAGHALVLLSGIGSDEQLDCMTKSIKNIADEQGVMMIPAFYPEITTEHHLWKDVENNYAYRFKNFPHHFHNGGIWPVMSGLLSLAYKLRNKQDDIKPYDKTLLRYLEKDEFRFREYIDTQSYSFGGQEALCFSAAGAVFMSSPVDQLHLLKP